MASIKKLSNVEEYNKFIASENKTVIVKFGGSWCSPCKLLRERILSMDDTKLVNVLIGEVDVDNETMESVISDCGIRGIPVLVYYKDGKEVERTVGLTTADAIYNSIEKLS